MNIRRFAALVLTAVLALSLTVSTVAAEAQKQPKTGILYDRDDSSYSILKINAPENDPVYVKILRYNPETGRNKKTPVKLLYIRAGKSLTIDMPSGEYTLRYATGTTWYGEEELFGTGSDAIYTEADTRLKYERRGEGYEITLQMVHNGNLSSTKMSRDKF